MQQGKYKIIGIVIVVICVILLSVIISDSVDRLKAAKGKREKIGTFIDIILDILDWYELVVVAIIGLIIGGVLIFYW